MILILATNFMKSTHIAYASAYAPFDTKTIAMYKDFLDFFSFFP